MTATPTRDQFQPAAEAVIQMLRKTSVTDLARPTPCRGWDLGQLARHAVGTTTGLARIAHKEDLGPDPWAGPDVAAADWSQVLAGRIESLALAWSQDDAWSGTVQLGAEMPASAIGDMAYAEILLHGWDVARSVGAEFEVDPVVASALRNTVEATAELGRQMGAYGPAAEVPAEAGDFERGLAAAGRDPSWTPA